VIRLGDNHANRTGIAINPELAQAMLRAVELANVDERDGEAAAELRMSYAREGALTGSMPPITTLRGAGKTLVKSLRGNLDVLIDKLGERLAFERSAVRLYELLLDKLEVHKSWNGGPTHDLLLEFREQEHEHFVFLRAALERFGADPTAVTPSANLHVVASSGIVQVLSDPRTDLEDGLEAVLVAELTDNDCWATLIGLAGNLGEDELASRCEHAFEEEERHLMLVRGWLRAALGVPAQSALTPQRPTPSRTTAVVMASGGEATARKNAVQRHPRRRGRTKRNGA
jgi:hypothetical protein